jgi:hypothetical protein
MKPTSMLIALVPLLLTACDPTIFDGSGIDLGDLFGGGSHDPPGPSDPPDPPDPPEPGTGGTGGGANPEDLAQATAMTRAHRDALADAYWEQVASETGSVVSTGTGGGIEPDPNEIILEVSDLALMACDIYPVRVPCGGHWKLSFTLPAAYQQVGVYNLDDPALHGSVFETFESYDSQPDSCGMGGGTFFGFASGTLEILAIDDAEVRFRLAVEGSPMERDPSGEYTAPRCP